MTFVNESISIADICYEHLMKSTGDLFYVGDNPTDQIIFQHYAKKLHWVKNLLDNKQPMFGFHISSWEFVQWEVVYNSDMESEEWIEIICTVYKYDSSSIRFKAQLDESYYWKFPVNAKNLAIRQQYQQQLQKQFWEI